MQEPEKNDDPELEAQTSKLPLSDQLSHRRVFLFSGTVTFRDIICKCPVKTKFTGCVLWGHSRGEQVDTYDSGDCVSWLSPPAWTATDSKCQSLLSQLLHPDILGLRAGLAWPHLRHTVSWQCVTLWG